MKSLLRLMLIQPGEHEVTVEVDADSNLGQSTWGSQHGAVSLGQSEWGCHPGAVSLEQSTWSSQHGSSQSGAVNMG